MIDNEDMLSKRQLVLIGTKKKEKYGDRIEDEIRLNRHREIIIPIGSVNIRKKNSVGG